MQRRQFLRGLGPFAAAAGTTLGCHSWIARSHAASTPEHRLIVIFLRGAVDGLNVLVPYQEKAYYEARPSIAIPRPGQSEGQSEGAIALNPQFALHPQLAMLLPLWQQQQLALVQNCGLMETTRSHFDAQNDMESGTPGSKRTADGWMNRLLRTFSQASNPIQALNVGNAMPRILAGPAPVASLAAGRAAEKVLALDRPPIAQAFDRLYLHDQKLGSVYQEAQAARQALQSATQREMTAANNGAPLPKGFVQDAQRLARVMANDGRVQLAFLDLGGWDTHVNQGASQGLLARNLNQLGQGLVALKTGLGHQFESTTIVVMSEFGRTLQENGNGGTDHGHGNVMLLLGGKLPGKKVYGNWQGLDKLQLHEGRDLPVTTDFRDVLIRVLETRMRLSDRQLTQVFPNYQPQQRLWS